MARFDLSDFEWSVIEPLLPTKVRGVASLAAKALLSMISATAGTISLALTRTTSPAAT